MDAKQRFHNIRTKVRLTSERTWRTEGYGPCTGDLEREFVIKEMDRLPPVEAIELAKVAL